VEVAARAAGRIQSRSRLNGVAVNRSQLLGGCWPLLAGAHRFRAQARTTRPAPASSRRWLRIALAVSPWGGPRPGSRSRPPELRAGGGCLEARPEPIASNWSKAASFEQQLEGSRRGPSRRFQGEAAGRFESLSRTVSSRLCGLAERW